MTQKLKPCPFCGGIPDELQSGFVICSNLGCLMQENTCTKEQWNTRQPSPDKLNEGKSIDEVLNEKIIQANQQGLVRFVFAYQTEYYFCEWLKAKWSDLTKIEIL